jgi:hypothetical protein
MTTSNNQHSVVIFGKSRQILAETVAGLRDLGYRAIGISDFLTNVAERFDGEKIDLVSLGRLVPPDRNITLREEFTAINPQVRFIESPGVPSVIISQVQAVFNDSRGAPRA